MNIFDDLNEKNYLHFAMKFYDNRQCTSIEEFNEDLNKIKYVKRLFNRFLETGELRTNLILNHLIVIYNVSVSYTHLPSPRDLSTSRMPSSA